MQRRAFLTTVAAASAAGLAGCLGSGETTDYDIGMGASAFRPETFETSVGETVTWGNGGSRNHSVTAYEDGIPDDAEYFASGGFEGERAARDAWFDEGGGVISTGQTYEYTFAVAGRYEYFCIPHEPAGMVGTVVVTE